MSEWNCRLSVLEDVAKGMKEHEKVPVANLEVHLFRDNGKKPVVTLDLAVCIDFIAHDIYFNEEANWSDTFRAEVHTY